MSEDPPHQSSSFSWNNDSFSPPRNEQAKLLEGQQKNLPKAFHKVFYIFFSMIYSTVTDLARFLGWSTSVPLATAVW